MIGITIDQSNDDIIINWQLAKIAMPFSEITKVTQDDTYAGEGKNAIKIGTPYATTDRIVLQTTSDTYILFTTNAISIENKIATLIHQYNRES